MNANKTFYHFSETVENFYDFSKEERILIFEESEKISYEELLDEEQENLQERGF